MPTIMQYYVVGFRSHNYFLRTRINKKIFENFELTYIMCAYFYKEPNDISSLDAQQQYALFCRHSKL